MCTTIIIIIKRIIIILQDEFMTMETKKTVVARHEDKCIV